MDAYAQTLKICNKRGSKHPDAYSLLGPFWRQISVRAQLFGQSKLRGRFQLNHCEYTLQMTSLCVFCGSRHGKNPAYAQSAQLVGREIARRGWRLVYGGGNVGL